MKSSVESKPQQNWKVVRTDTKDRLFVVSNGTCWWGTSADIREYLSSGIAAMTAYMESEKLEAQSYFSKGVALTLKARENKSIGQEVCEVVEVRGASFFPAIGLILGIIGFITVVRLCVKLISELAA